MRTSAVAPEGQHAAAIHHGWAKAAGLAMDDETESIEYENDEPTAMQEGDVVVLKSNNKLGFTTTISDERPTGVVQDDIDPGDFGPVIWWGPVDQVNTTGSVTAGNFGRTSTTGGQAEEITPATGAFIYFTSSGTNPSGFMFGIGGGGGFGGGSGGGAEVPVDHGNMGATETIDIADGTWHRGTLDDDVTITVTGFTVDEGLVAIFEATLDGTGGHAITWDPDVDFIGEDQPDQAASSVSVFLLFSSAGDGTIYGVKVGGGLSSETLETAGHYELLMDGGSPPEPIEDGSGTDWLYVWVP